MSENCKHPAFTLSEAQCDDCGEWFNADDDIVLAFRNKDRDQHKRAEAALESATWNVRDQQWNMDLDLYNAWLAGKPKEDAT